MSEHDKLILEAARKLSKSKNSCRGIYCRNCPLSILQCLDRETRSESAREWLKRYEDEYK